MDNYRKTVNLRSGTERKEHENKIPKKRLVKKITKSRDEEETARELKYRKKDFSQITRPEAKRDVSVIYKQITVFLALAIIIFGAYWFFVKNDRTVETVKQQEMKWYAVKLSDNKFYYGQIKDISADPIVVENVYYDYDQSEDKAGADKSETASLRLVKRGKETHGPSGTMDIVRSQVLYMEPLREDSKVLRAILDYEK